MRTILIPSDQALWATARGAITLGAAVAVAGCALREADPTRPRPLKVERQAYVMGTTLVARVEVPAAAGAEAPATAEAAERAARAIEAAFRAVERLDRLLSTWDEATPVSRLNRAPVGEPVALAPDLGALLLEAERWAERTGRAFEPAIGPLIDAWDLRGAGRRPTAAELDSALAAVRAGVRLEDGGTRAARMDARAWIDTGGFGKGAALRQAGRALRSRGVDAALLDFGGQLLALGAPAGEAGWRVGVAHPAQREQVSAELLVRDVSVATSGASERFVEVGGERFGHLLDPRTGQPVPPWGSVTVVTADAFAADALSTALYVLGPERGMEWVRERADVGALFLEDTPEGVVVTFNEAMRPWLDRMAGPADQINDEVDER